MVGRWQGSASRSLMMHADPLAAHAYRWLGGLASTAAHRCVVRLVLAPSARPRPDVRHRWSARTRQFADRLVEGGVANVETIRMGVESGVFAPSLRSAALRSAALHSLGLDEAATLLIGVGRLSAEKRWPMVLRAVAAAARSHPVGMVLVGDGRQRARLELLAGRLPSCAVHPASKIEMSLRCLMASADALVHGCEAETFCLVAAEARASGIPIIVPDRGAALDQLAEAPEQATARDPSDRLTQAIGAVHRPRPGVATCSRGQIQPRAHDGRTFCRAFFPLRAARAVCAGPGGIERLRRRSPGFRPSPRPARRRRCAGTPRRSGTPPPPSDPRSRAAFARPPGPRAIRAR